MQTVYAYDKITKQFTAVIENFDDDVAKYDDLTTVAPTNDMLNFEDKSCVVFNPKKQKWEFKKQLMSVNLKISEIRSNIRERLKVIMSGHTIEFKGNRYDLKGRHVRYYFEQFICASNGLIDYPFSIIDVDHIEHEINDFDEFKSFIKIINDECSKFNNIGKLICYGGEINGITIKSLYEYTEKEISTFNMNESIFQCLELNGLL